MQLNSGYPDAFLSRMKGQLGDEYDAFLDSLLLPAPVSVRSNPYKVSEHFEKEECVPWCSNGRYLKERPSFTFDPLFHAGTYYVQEASSMFIEQAWKTINPQNKTVRLLDLCAAPGGKSTHLLSLMNGSSLLVTNEVIPARNKILQENISKWGCANVVVTQNKASDFPALGNYFDIVLVDAPCSGEGLFRKDKEAVEEWSEKNVQMCSVRQKEILESAIGCLKPQGYLIYSTCTFASAENDENMKWLATQGMDIIKPEMSDFGQAKTTYGYQFYPHKIRGEGYYIAVARKTEDTSSYSAPRETQKPNPKKLLKQKTDFSFAKGYLNPDKFEFHSKNEFLFALPVALNNEFLFLEKHLYLRQAGISLGHLKGKDFIPSHDLALCNAITPSVNAVELNLEDAISYLRCNAPSVKTSLRGWVLAQYKGFNLGWMKVMEGRINNYFPKERRILKQP